MSFSVAIQVAFIEPTSVLAVYCLKLTSYHTKNNLRKSYWSRAEL